MFTPEAGTLTINVPPDANVSRLERIKERIEIIRAGLPGFMRRNAA